MKSQLSSSQSTGEDQDEKPAAGDPRHLAGHRCRYPGRDWDYLLQANQDRKICWKGLCMWGNQPTAGGHNCEKGDLVQYQVESGGLRDTRQDCEH